MLNQKQQEEIDQLKDTLSSTKRPTVPGLEKVLYEVFPVLDHGFIRVIDYMGDDGAIVQAARVSYGRGTKKLSEDQGLINYLMRHRHSTPFEMCEIKFHVKVPIFVARQWLRHRTANVNEYSARYSILDREFYIPAAEQLSAQAAHNRQGRHTLLAGEEAKRVLEILKQDSHQCYDHYEEMLNLKENGEPIDPERLGLARELARMNIPTNCYTQFYWKIDLHNFLHFLSLRADHHAQYEIKVYADQLVEILKLWTPLVYNAFERYRLGGVFVSKEGWTVIKNLLKEHEFTDDDREKSGLSKGEWSEFLALFS